MPKDTILILEPSVAAAARQLQNGLQEVAEKIFKTMVPDVPVTEAMRDYGAGALTLLQGDVDYSAWAFHVAEIMLGNSEPARCARRVSVQ